MWLGALFTSTAASFGRLLLVGLLPNAILVAYVWVVVAMGAFKKSEAPLFFDDLGLVNFKTDAGGLLLFVLLVVTLTAVIQPFQIRLVRMVEGYWHGRLLALASRIGVAAHERRRRKLIHQVNAPDEPPADDEICQEPIEQQVRLQRETQRLEKAAARAQEKLRSYPPAENEVLPTMLGNVLRRSERVSGERYGLTTIYSWPRLLPLLGPKITAEYDSETDSVDASTNLAVVFAVMSLIGFAAFANDTWMLSVPIGLLLLSLAAYRAAIAAASHLGLTMAVAYDLHRFDLIRGLHLDLPVTPAQEIASNQRISGFLAATDTLHSVYTVDRGLKDFSYRHPKPD